MTKPHFVRRLRARLRQCRRDERGAVTSELVLAVPALMLLILLIAQFAIWAHATHIAQATASQALSAARVQDATSADGHAATEAVLAQLGSGPLRTPHAVVNRGSSQSTVEITGKAASVVPFLELPVKGHAVGPSERFVGPGGNE